MKTQDAVNVLYFDQLEVRVFSDADKAGKSGAEWAGRLIRDAVAERGEANVVLATGNSQLPFLNALVSLPDVPWERVRIFHLDEYIGIRPEHPASFVRYVREKVVDVVGSATFYPIQGDTDDADRVCREYEELLRTYPADIACIGIGENGHLAFNEPYDADFEDERWVRTIRLDDRSRFQQVGEGHFASVESVPSEAITLTIPALLAAKHVMVQVPEARKAEAVKQTLYGPISNACPASILRTCSHARLYLDLDSAAGITGPTGGVNPS